MKRAVWMVACLACLAATVTADVVAVRSLGEQLRTLTWPMASARVEADGSAYRYTVAGREYRSGAVRLTGGSALASQQQKREAYGPGKAVTARYDPAEPARSVLEPGLAAADLRPLFLLLPIHSVGLMLFGVVVDLVRRGHMRGPATRKLRGGGVRLGYPAWPVPPLVVAGAVTAVTGSLVAWSLWQASPGAEGVTQAAKLIGTHLSILLGVLGLGWAASDREVELDRVGRRLRFPGGTLPLSSVRGVTVEPGGFGQPRRLLVETDSEPVPTR